METVIQLIHFCVILFIVFAPFSSNRTLILLHVITIPFLMLHWILANDTCALTLIECIITGKSKEETFIGKTMNGIYNISSKEIWGITTILWFISIYRLQRT
jgi:hypothetical protein